MQSLTTQIDALLSRIQETVPTATIAQVEDILLAQVSTPDAVLSKPGKLAAFIRIVEQAQPGGLAVPEVPIVSALKVPQAKAIATQSASLSVPVPESAPVVEGDRDWAVFDIRTLATLTKAELLEFKEWRAEQAEIKALMNEILGDEAATIAAEELALKNKVTIAETNRRVLQARAQVEVMEGSGGDLDQMVTELGKQTALDQMDRDRQAFTNLADLGKSTPTEGELALLQGTIVNRDRMNRAATLQNSIAPMVKAIGASPEKPMVTIDA